MARPLCRRACATANAAGFVRFCLDPSGSANYVVSVAQPGYGAGAILAAVVQNQTTPLTMFLTPTSNTGTIRLDGRLPQQARAPPGPGGHLRRLAEHQQHQGRADFTGLAAGNYMAYIATGFSGGNPTWSTGKVGSRPVGGQLWSYPGAMRRFLASIRARLGSRGDQRRYTLIELLMGIILASVFAVGPCTASSSRGCDAFRTHESQARAQSTGRTALNQVERDLRQVDQPRRRAHGPGDRPQPHQPRDLRQPPARDLGPQAAAPEGALRDRLQPAHPRVGGPGRR